MKTFMIATGKVMAAACTIAMIGGLMLVVSEDQGVPEVAPAQADIAMLGMGPTKTDMFVEALDDLGMDKPRPYDWNGNKVFFSTMTTTDTPEQILVKFQKKFEAEGINKKAYLESLENLDHPDPSRWQAAGKEVAEEQAKRFAEHWERDSEFFAGGVVPVTISKDYVAMAGTVTKGDAKDGFDFIKEMSERGKGKNITEHVAGMRYVEATRQGRGTRVNAIWSDEDIEFSKFHDGKKSSNVSMSAKVPSCMGCTRLMRFAGESEAEEKYVMNIYEGTLSVPVTVDFYEQAMQNRGWRLGPTTRMLRRLEEQGIKPRSDAEMLSFEKDGEFVTMVIHPEGGRTSVQIMESP